MIYMFSVMCTTLVVSMFVTAIALSGIYKIEKERLDESRRDKKNEE